MPGFNEEINANGHILYWYDSDVIMQNSSRENKILGMDLDWTVIRPIKGKIHPLDEHDWQFLFDAKYMRAINDKVAEGYKLVIFTNQGGLLAKRGGKMDVEGFKRRWQVILERLKSLYDIKPAALLVSLYDDFNRKPCIGMWEYLEELLQVKYEIKVDRSASLYVGDMAGRKGDHSASDLLFAMNLGVDFQVPEVFYGIAGECELAANKTSVLKKNVLEDEQLFNPTMEKISKRQSKINAATRDEILAMLEDKHKQSLVIFMGSPASGKSSWYAKYLKGIAGLVYLGMDTFNGTLGKFHKEVEANLKKGENVVVDNTNGTSKAREKLATLAKGVKKETGRQIQVIVVYFNTEKRVCLHLNALRTKMVNVCELQKKQNCGHNVPAVAIHTYWKYLEPVNLDKEPNIDVVYTLGWEPQFSGFDEKIYRLMI